MVLCRFESGGGSVSGKVPLKEEGMADGELVATASSGGRQITLDPLMEREALAVTPRRVESTIPCGFQINWFEGTGKHAETGVEVDFDLNAGAGMGSRWLTLSVKVPGEDGRRNECIDMQEFLGRWVDAVIEAGPTPEVTG